MDVQNCIARITNGQETVKVLAHFCCNNSILGIESVKKEFIINLDTVYNKPLRYLLKTWIEFIRFREFRVKKKEWLQWITGIFFSSLIFYNMSLFCSIIDHSMYKAPVVCSIRSDLWVSSGLNRNQHWVKKNAEIVCHII